MKKLWVLIPAVLIILQFISINKNAGQIKSSNYIGNAYALSDSVETVLNRSCFDCHSNSTNYPWYASVQPLGFWLQHHVDEGKKELNFSEFLTYSLKKKKHKLHEIEEVINENEMPLTPYVLVHKESKLSDEDKSLLLNWVQTTTLSLK